MQPFPFQRIVVIGVTGSGKSTLAEQLAGKLDLAFVELDALHWEPNWTEAPDDVFLRRVQLATASERWAVAGNYSKARAITWPRAEAVIWLDYSLGLILRRLWVRSWKRWRSKELLWGTNYERMWPHFKIWSDESLFKWAIKTYPRRKREYPVLFRQYPHLKVFRFKDPKELEAWFSKISAGRNT